MGKSVTKNRATKYDGLLSGSLWRLYRVFGIHILRQWTLLLLAAFGMIASIATTLLQPWPLALILDHVILAQPLPTQLAFLESWTGQNANFLLAILAFSFVLIMFVDALVSYIHRYYLAAASGQIMTDMRKRIFTHLQHLSMSFHGRAQSGDVAYRLTSDIKDVKTVIVDGPTSLVNRGLKIASAAVALSLLEWRLAAVALLIVPLLYYYSVRFGKGVKKATKEGKKQESKVASLVAETMTAMALIQAYGREDAEEAAFLRENQASVKARVSALQLSEIFKRFSDLLVAAGTMLVVFVGGYLALSGALLPGTLVVAVSYLKPLYSPVDKLAVLFVQMIQAQVAGERLLEFMEGAQAVAETDDALDPPPLQGRVEFRNVSFGYQTGQEVLRQLNFVAEPGQTVALVGYSGAGKSTLMSLLLRFYDPDQGQILFDGYDIRTFRVAGLREQMTLVFQEALLLRQSIRANIAMGKTEATELEIEEAAKLAQVHDFICSLPDGYETLVEEDGNNLSGGQRQRISIARAILRDTPIVLLDEPSTALDARSAYQVQAALKELTKGRTTFVIAHNFETILHADQILVLEEGKMAQQGTHDVLMRISPQYRELYELQFGQQSADIDQNEQENRRMALLQQPMAVAP